MIADCLRGLDLTNVSRVVIGVLREHIDEFCAGTVEFVVNSFKRTDFFSKLRFVVLPNRTRDHVETALTIIRMANISGPVFIKDCHNAFTSIVPFHNAVCMFKITQETDHEMRSLARKSFCSFSHDNSLDNVVTETIVSPYVCTGGYAFRDAGILETVAEIMRAAHPAWLYSGFTPLTMSDIIFRLVLMRSEPVVGLSVVNFEDWQTTSAWRAFYHRRTALVDV